MARYRSRSRSHSPRRRSRTPPRGRKRYYDDVEEDRHRDYRSRRDRRSPAPSGLLIRNLPLEARAEDIRPSFEKFGPVKDVYLPKNYYTGEPRGFGFVKYRYAEDAAEAKLRMNHKVIGGREIRIVFADENRKTPQEMRVTTRIRDHRHRGSYRDRSPPRSPRRRYRSSSPSPSHARHSSRDHGGNDAHSPRRYRSYSRSPPRDERNYTPDQRSPSPRENGSPPGVKGEHASGRLRSPRGSNPSPSRSRSQSFGSR